MIFICIPLYGTSIHKKSQLNNTHGLTILFFEQIGYKGELFKSRIGCWENRCRRSSDTAGGKSPPAPRARTCRQPSASSCWTMAAFGLTDPSTERASRNNKVGNSTSADHLPRFPPGSHAYHRHGYTYRHFAYTKSSRCSIRCACRSHG